MDITWTVAFRKNRANRFLRVDGVALPWDEATELALEVKEALGDGYEVYYVPTLASESERSFEDQGSILVDSGRRVQIKEGGVLPEGVIVSGYTEPVKAERPLGKNQALALKTLKERNNGVWTPGCGWTWNNYSTTVRLLDSLVRRGLVTKTEGTNRAGQIYPIYRIVTEETVAITMIDAGVKRTTKDEAVRNGSPVEQTQTVEIVLPARFAEFIEGTNLIQNSETDGDPFADEVMAAWNNARSRNGQTVLTLTADQRGKNVLDWLYEYAYTIGFGAGSYSRGEKSAAMTVRNRVSTAKYQIYKIRQS